MKKYLLSMAAVLSLGMVIVSCSSKDVYDEGNAADLKQQQRVATYQQAFTKEFGTIASGHQWGFDQTTGHSSKTRLAVSSTPDLWIIPDNFMGGNPNAEGWNANGLDWDGSVSSLSKTLSDFDFSNYFLQHVEQPKGGYVKNGTQLQAYNSSTGKWEDVTGFSKGKSTTAFNLTGDYLDIETTYFSGALNKSAARTTLMADMGGSSDNGNLFRIQDEVKIKGKVSYEYNYDYGFITKPAYHKETGEWVPAETFLVIEFSGNNHWIIRIGEAQKFKIEENPVVAEGRVFCEDMGANDFDFNDVVFDATILKTGVIEIKVLAHGGTLPVAIDGVDVTLGEMTNTGGEKANYQEFTIPAVNGNPKYATIDAIPVTVNPNGGADNTYNLTAPIGSAPQKICVPVGTLWPKEYTKINLAYSPFTEWVSILDPAEWYFEMDPSNVYDPTK